MRLTVQKVDGRGANGTRTDVIDEDASDVVGEIHFMWPNGREVALFGDRYKGTFRTHEECVAFITGVQAVLEHMIG